MTRISRILPGLWLLGASAYAGTYIVKLSADPVAAPASARPGAFRRAMIPPGARGRAQVTLEQHRVRTAIERETTARVIASVDTVLNALIVDVPDDNLDALRAVPGVVRVYPDREYKPLLKSALPLVSAPNAWFLVGGSEFAGAGAKIAIIDTGVDQTHPSFQDPTLTVPDGFPKGDASLTNNKVIVARGYSGDAVDRIGHGTQVAGAAASGPALSPIGMMSGVAPKAWIGNYKVFNDTSGGASSSAILKAMDDAVKDGMDVINMSLGSALAEPSADSVNAEAIANASQQGVVVVVAAGNSGPDLNTISDMAVSADSVAVGATYNDRKYVSRIRLADNTTFTAPGLAVNATGHGDIAAPIRDIASLDPTGLGCTPLPAGSLSGMIALILRGTCFFETKLQTAQNAGAVAAVIYNSSSALTGMAVGSATLPAVMITNTDGINLKSFLRDGPVAATFVLRAEVMQDPNTIALFSSAGPSADVTIKPDLLAVGYQLTMPSLRTLVDANITELYDPSGYLSSSGTSFSSPIVAGAAAVLKAARRGLSTSDYRSLLVNGASSFAPTVGARGVQRTGAGILNLENAVVSSVSASPVSVSFGAGSGTVQQSKTITIKNIGIVPASYSLSVEPSGGGQAPVLDRNSLQLDPGASAAVQLQFSASGLQPGQYEGVVIVHPSSGPNARIPYWYAVPSGTPQALTILDSDATATAGATDRCAFVFRVTDATGVAVSTVLPTVSGAGSRVYRVNMPPPGQDCGLDHIPDAWTADVPIAPGSNSFLVQAGGLSQTVTILGQ